MSFFISDWSWGSSYGPSCICLGQRVPQRVLTPQGWEGLSNLLGRHKAGHRVEVVITDHITGEQRASPLLLALETVARATRLTLADGRTLEITDGHAVPSERPVGDHWGPRGGTLALRRVNLSPASMRAYCRARRFKSDDDLKQIADTAYLTNGRIVHHQTVEWSRNVAEWAQRWAPIAEGDRIDGSNVVKVERLGLQGAARLAAADIGWLSISRRDDPRPSLVGQRLHEYEGSWGVGPVRMRNDEVEIGKISAVYVNPLVWGPEWDFAETARLQGQTVEEVAFRREGGPKEYHFIGPTAHAIRWSETEAAYRWGYLEPRGQRWARGERITEDAADTLRPLSRETRAGQRPEQSKSGEGLRRVAN